MWKCKAAVGYLMMLLEGLMLCPKGYTVLSKKKWLWTQRFLSCMSEEFDNSLQTRISCWITCIELEWKMHADTSWRTWRYFCEKSIHRYWNLSFLCLRIPGIRRQRNVRRWMRRFSALMVLHVQAHADYSKAIADRIAGVILDFCFFIVSPEMQ